MYKCPSKLLDEILTETKNYRCEYLNILIEKYVKTQDESWEINLRHFTVAKSSNYLKRIEDKPFGYVSSYECKTAKKSINFWKKKVILQKRAAFRKYINVDSSNGNSGKSLKYLSPTKAYKAFLSIEREKLYSSEEEAESILSNETVLDCDQTFSEENESILSYEDNSLLSDTKKISSKKSQNKVFTENETIKSLETTVKNDQLSANNDQRVSNFKVKNRDVNLKFDDSEELDILMKKNLSAFNDRCGDKASKIVYKKLSVHFKGISPPKNRENRSSPSRSNSMSFAGYAFNKFTPKFRLSDIGLGISDGNCQASSDFNAISLPYASNKSIESSKLRHWEDRMSKFNNGYQASKCNDKLLYDSNKSTEYSKLRCREVRMDISNKNGQTSNDCSTKSLLASNKSAELSKLSPNKIRNSHKNCGISNDYTAKSVSYDLNKPTEAPKLRSREVRMDISNKNGQTSNDFSTKSLLASNKSAELSKLSPSKIRNFHKNCGISNDYTVKSVSYDLNKPTEAPKLRSNKNCQPSSDCNAKSLPYVSNNSAELSKFSFNKIRVESSNKISGSSSDYAAKSLSDALNKSTQVPKLRFMEDKMVAANKYCQSSEDCNVKSLSCASKKLAETPKLRPRENGMVISNKDCQASSACNVKLSIFTPNKSIKPPKHSYSETKTRTSNRNCQAFSNSFSLKSTSLSSSFNPDISVEIDPLSLKKGSYDKKLKKKKSSLAQSTLPFQKCKSYTIEGANIDDLSFKKDSTPRKTPKNKLKEAYSK